MSRNWLCFNGLNISTGTFIPVSLNDYKERVSYDPNGNITSYMRNGNTSLPMDQLAYKYIATTNQLDHVEDKDEYATPTPASNYIEDIDNQSSGNYTYDKIGNLKTDVSEGISDISWNVYGKIASITKSTATITYSYDAAGNRISKTVVPATGNTKTTIYVRDATGNVMSVYEKESSADIKQKEINLYGSSRIGVKGELTVSNQNISLSNGFEDAVVSTFTRGEDNYELSNHLGNVLVTLTDKKIQHSDGNGGIDYYEADITTANDYYPFGMAMPGRTFSTGNAYRYGFNGKEKATEIANDDLDFGARIYDGKLGRWLSLDPLQKKYPSFSPYNFVLNSPLQHFDVDGKDVGVSIVHNPQGGGTITFCSDIYITGVDAAKKVEIYNKGFEDFIKANPNLKSSDGKWKVEINMNFKVAKPEDVARIRDEKAESSSDNLVTELPAGGDNRAYAQQRGSNYSSDVTDIEMIRNPYNSSGTPSLRGKTLGNYKTVGNQIFAYPKSDGRTAVHEVLHNFGLNDYYADVSYEYQDILTMKPNVGKVIGSGVTEEKSIAYEGFKNSIMATGTILQQEHVDDLVNTALAVSANKVQACKESNNFVMGRVADSQRNTGGNTDASKVPQTRTTNNGSSKRVEKNPLNNRKG